MTLPSLRGTSAEPPVPAQAAPSSSAARVLVVDDNRIDRRVAEGLIERRLGWQVLSAGNGVEALHLIAKESPDLVLTDLLMPEMDGLQLVEAIRTNHSQVPVILMTAHGSEDIALHALRNGAASYVPKKTLQNELTGTLEQVLAASRAGRQQQRLWDCLSQVEAQFVLENDPTFVRDLVAHVQAEAGHLKLLERSRVRLGIALEEALLHGIYRGNLEISPLISQQGTATLVQLAAERRKLPAYCNRRLNFRVKLSRAEAVFVIRVDGPGFLSAPLSDQAALADLGQTGGRGLVLIRTFMDEVTYDETGKQLALVKRQEPSRREKP